MQNMVRVTIIVFLAALILLNYNSTRLLNIALSSLNSNVNQRTQLLTKEIASELKARTDLGEQAQAEKFLHYLKLHYSLYGVFLYDPQFRRVVSASESLPPDVEGMLDSPILWNPPKSQRLEHYLILPGSYRTSTGSPGQFAVLFNVGEITEIEQSTKVISYLNFVLIGVTALLALYFLESTLKSYRVLMQTARSAPNEVSPGENRNDADFLIGTFKGVIAKLKEKEQELARLHLAEKARADNVQQLNQDLIRSVSSGLMIMDLAGKITVFNEAAQSMLHLPRLTVLHESYQKVIARVSEPFKQDIDDCFASRAAISRAELEIETPDGSRFLGANIMPLKDREQRFSGVFCLFTDITDFKALQQQMSLKEKFASLGEMAAGVAHEFRNSAATISGYLQLLEKKMEAEQSVYVSGMQKELKVLQGVVNDFLSFARPVQLDISAVKLQELIKETLEDVRISPPFASIQFSYSGNLPVIQGDESMLRQVFANLIRNAAESIEGTGRNGVVKVRASQTPRVAVIEICDNGVGIPRGDLSRVFAPFFTTKRKGVGLGLAIVQKLILQHNGIINVESSPEGSTFRVQLPIAES